MKHLITVALLLTLSNCITINHYPEVVEKEVLSNEMGKGFYWDDVVYPNPAKLWISPMPMPSPYPSHWQDIRVDTSSAGSIRAIHGISALPSYEVGWGSVPHNKFQLSAQIDSIKNINN